MAAIGHGALKEGQIANKMKELYDKDHPVEITDAEVLKEIETKRDAYQMMLPKGKAQSGIVVRGVDDVAVRFSKCCSPVPGDEIIGFVTRGRGVSIHRTDCVNIINLPEIDRGRLIDAEWQAGSEESSKYLAEIVIYAHNRNGLLADISRALTEKNIDIMSMNTKTSKQGIATMAASFYIGSREELNHTIEKLRNVESVMDIERTTG